VRAQSPAVAPSAEQAKERLSIDAFVLGVAFRPVDLDQPVDVTVRIRPGLHGPQGPGENSIEDEAAEEGADRPPRPAALEQVTPAENGLVRILQTTPFTRSRPVVTRAMNSATPPPKFMTRRTTPS
jgi:hypothetical protein